MKRDDDVKRSARVGTFGFAADNPERVTVSKHKDCWRVFQGPHLLKIRLTFEEAIADASGMTE